MKTHNANTNIVCKCKCGKVYNIHMVCLSELEVYNLVKGRKLMGEFECDTCSKQVSYTLDSDNINFEDDSIFECAKACTDLILRRSIYSNVIEDAEAELSEFEYRMFDIPFGNCNWQHENGVYAMEEKK
jgi:hypothetical protein